MQVSQYLKRIGYAGPTTTSLETLFALHRAHLLAIPYENLDIHLARELKIDFNCFYEKIVVQKRGGWCFEMNGLFAWALRELGFEVHLLFGSVNRQDLAAPEFGDHLVLLVCIDKQNYLTDVGFGDAFLEPLPLRAGRYVRHGFELCLEEPMPGRWVLHNHPFGGAKHFDVSLRPCELKDFESKCHWLQTHQESHFVQMLVCQRFTANGIVVLRDATRSFITPTQKTNTAMNNPEEFDRVLRQDFLLEIPEAKALFEKASHNHQEFLKRKAEEVTP